MIFFFLFEQYTNLKNISIFSETIKVYSKNDGLYLNQNVINFKFFEVWFTDLLILLVTKTVKRTGIKTKNLKNLEWIL